MKTVAVDGLHAVSELYRLRSEYPRTGLYPIILGDEEDLERLEEGRYERFDPEAILAESRKLNPARWLARRPKEAPELYDFPEGEWPEDEPEEMGIVTHLDVLSREPKSKVFIGLLRVNSPWEVFAHLQWGGWNDCPLPAVHCALHRYWEEKWGAQPSSVTGDVVQCIVTRPPLDHKAALALAREQYIYCYDIVDQGVQSIAVLAAGLRCARHWFFWWD